MVVCQVLGPPCEWKNIDSGCAPLLEWYVAASLQGLVSFLVSGVVRREVAGVLTLYMLGKATPLQY